MKEIEQRNKEELLIKCSCGGQHFLSFDWWTDKNKWDDKDEKTKKRDTKNMWKDYTVTFIESQEDRFWYKVGQCWKYLFTRKGEICYSGINLTSKDLKKIIKHFEKYMDL